MALSWPEVLAAFFNTEGCYYIGSSVVPGVELKSSSYQIKNNTLPTKNSAYALIRFPQLPSLPGERSSSSAAAGLQFQIIEGTYSESQINPVTSSATTSCDITPPGTVIYSEVQQLLQPGDWSGLVQISKSNLSTTIQLPYSLLQEGKSYTIRSRLLILVPYQLGALFSSLESGGSPVDFFQTQEAFFTKWGFATFRVNAKPQVVNMRIVGSNDPLKIKAGTPIEFSFTLIDTDGPSFQYEIEVGVGDPFVRFWSSGLVSAGPGTGLKSISTIFVPPSGGTSIVPGTMYSWRVRPSDGLVTGDWSSPMSFKLNTPPRLTSLLISNNELVYQDQDLTTDKPPEGETLPVVDPTSVPVEWVYEDDEGTAQAAYRVTYGVAGANDGFVIEGIGDTSSIILSNFAEGQTVSIKVEVKDDVEYGTPVRGWISTNVKPRVTQLTINGEVNPGDVATATPTIAWVFNGSSSAVAQNAFQIQVFSDSEMTQCVWDTGTVVSFAYAIVYGSTVGPVVTPQTLLHSNGMYFAQVRVNDGISWSEWEAAFFAINTRPNNPVLTTPTSGSVYSPSDVLRVVWANADPLDPDGDSITTTIEITSRRSTNSGWNYLAGPFDSTVTSAVIDTSILPKGEDYGVRLVARDETSTCNLELPSASISGAFTISNHLPNPPTFTKPIVDQVLGSTLRVEWVEANPIDVDNDLVIYQLEITRTSNPVWQLLTTLPQGTQKYSFDINNYQDASDYQLRIKAIDQDGAESAWVYSGIFIISNSVTVKDFEKHGGSIYVSTSDGRILRVSETIWQVNQDYTSGDAEQPFYVYKEGSPSMDYGSSALILGSSKGSRIVLRH